MSRLNIGKMSAENSPSGSNDQISSGLKPEYTEMRNINSTATSSSEDDAPMKSSAG